MDRAGYPSAVTDEEWSFVAPCLTLTTEDAAQRVLSLREVFNISILFGAGLRREEITKLNLYDYKPEEAELAIRGKRSKQRIAYLGDDALVALMAWLERRRKDTGPLFIPVKRG